MDKVLGRRAREILGKIQKIQESFEMEESDQEENSGSGTEAAEREEEGVTVANTPDSHKSERSARRTPNETGMASVGTASKGVTPVRKSDINKKKGNLEVVCRENMKDLQLGSAASSPSTSRPNFKTIPVFKWNLKFPGTGADTAATFMAKVESMRQARHMTEEELFSSAADLLDGNALVWYEARKHMFTDWKEFKARFLKVFLPVNYQEDLEDEIKQRKQGKTESVELFVATMTELCARLPEPVSQEKQLLWISRNLRLNLQQMLSLRPVENVEELIEVCSKAEENEFRLNCGYQSTSGRRLFEPQQTANKFPGPAQQKLRYVQVAGAEERPALCYNCDEPGHYVRNCPSPRNRRIRCFKCGKMGVTSRNCPDCNATGGVGPSHSNGHRQESGNQGRSDQRQGSGNQRRPDQRGDFGNQRRSEQQQEQSGNQGRSDQRGDRPS